VVDSHGRFLWYELITTDMAAAKAFYADVLGWGAEDASTAGSAYTLFTAGGAAVSGMMSLSDEARKMGLQPSWLGYVGVTNVDAAADRLKQLGGTVHVPPTEIPNISRLAVGVDPQMVTIALFKWLTGETSQETGQETGRGPPDPDAPGRVGWHELLAADGEKAWAFYSELFGWQEVTATDLAHAYKVFSASGVTIGGMFTKPATEPAPFWLYYFNVADIDAAAKSVKAGSGQIIDGPIEVRGDRWTLRCSDPQGAIFALVGKRSHGIGYFPRISSSERSNPRSGVACTRIS
jgi:uncharacterized protein